MSKKTKGVVLLVEDDRNTAMLVAEWLERHQYDVDFAENGVDALNLAREHAYDVILLDVALPRLCGIEVCRRLREETGNGKTPVLMVTGRATLDDTLAGLDAGADDYLTKPFFPAELEARITALIRRRRSEVAPEILTVGDVVLDPGTPSVHRAGELLDVTPTGFRILQILMRESPRVVTRAEIEQELWGLEAPHSDALRSHVYVLRKALDRGRSTRILHTLPNVGYRVMPLQASELDAARRRRKQARRPAHERRAAAIAVNDDGWMQHAR